MKVVPGTKVTVPLCWTRVASSIPNVSPLRADTVPDTRPSPKPCIAPSTSTCDAANVTLEVAVPVGAVVLVGGVAGAAALAAVLATVNRPEVVIQVFAGNAAHCARPPAPVATKPLISY